MSRDAQPPPAAARTRVDLIWQATGDAVRLILTADAELMRIAGLSLIVSGAATLLAALIGIPLGVSLHLGRFPGRAVWAVLVNAGMALPPVVVGLVVMLVLWRTGPLGSLRLLFTPQAMVIAQVIVALPLIAGFSRAAISLLDADLVLAMRADGAGDPRIGLELARAAAAQVLVAVAAGFGRAISEVGASLMVGGNIVGQTRILTTAIALESGRGEFALALALGFILILLALGINALLGLATTSARVPVGTPV
jgi:tungstate transport system permease protein